MSTLPTGNHLPIAKGTLKIPADQPACATYCIATKNIAEIDMPKK